jgi:hypothetical protein
MSRILTWNEVQLEHGTIAAISCEGDYIKSILCGGPDYTDVIDLDYILYKIPNRKHYQKSLSRFNYTSEKKYKIRVFSKVFRNKWVDKKYYLIDDISIENDFWVIRLQKIIH